MYGKGKKGRHIPYIVSDKNLIYEANKINYSLRSTFFYRRLNELGYFQIIDAIEFLVKHSANYSWEDRKFWNITHNAWDAINKRKIEPLRVFAHPKVFVEHPKLVAYYRNTAVISLKGVQYLSFNVSAYENGKKTNMSYLQASELAKLFNAHISAIVESALSINMKNLNALMYSSAGTTIDGSWRNKIGDEAETMVKSYIARPAIENGWVDSLIDKNNSPVEFDPNFDYVANIFLFRGIKLKNRRTLLFSSEPDISFISEDAKPVTVIEVKGGTDPAGALERLGAIKKSFEHSRDENATVETILVVSCITDEMKTRLESDPLIDVVYNLTSLIIDMEYRDSFIKKLIVLLS